ncbi:MAG: hypothetical protein IT306_14585 [Chloroflexi bacterium]|nr:hypothetical protein [Chloroflexota bacterium]
MNDADAIPGPNPRSIKKHDLWPAVTTALDAQDSTGADGTDATTPPVDPLDPRQQREEQFLRRGA